MKFQPRPRFEALAVRGERMFRSELGFWGFGGPSRSLDPPKAPGGPLRRPGTAWKPPTCMDEAE